jgi:hypothetical protein
MSSHDHNAETGVHQTTYKQPAGKVPTDATEAKRVDVDKVEGETVLVNHSSAQHITGERVSLKHSKASSIDSKSVQLDKSAVVTVKSENTVLQDSAAMLVSAETVKIGKSGTALVSAREAQFEEGSQAILVLTGGIRGEARALVAVPAAAVVAAVAGLLLSLAIAVIRGSRR